MKVLVELKMVMSVLILLLFHFFSFVVIGYVHSSMNVTAINTPNLKNNSWFGRAAVAVGDLNGDGRDDFAVAAALEITGRVYLYDGNTKDTIATLHPSIMELGGTFGWSLASAGDVNNDGVNDLIIGAAFQDVESVDAAGRVYVFDGRSRTLIHTIESVFPASNGRFGELVMGLGDVNGDNHDEFIITSARLPSLLFVFDGASGDTLYSVMSPEGPTGFFGMSASAVSDITEDGKPDIMVGASGHVYFFDGVNGLLVRELQPPVEEYAGQFGKAVAELGDINGDEVADYIVGTAEPVAGMTSAGRAYIFDGATGDTLRSLVSPNPLLNGMFSLSLSATGDVDHDGAGDVIIGAYFEGAGESPEQAGRAYVFSSVTGELLYEFASTNEQSSGWFGLSVAAADLNGDGGRDFLVGAYNEEVEGYVASGHVYLFESTITTDIETDNAGLTGFGLSQNYPNPFNPSTSISYELPATGYVSLKVYNMTGQEVKALVAGNKGRGVNTVEWDGRNKNGQIVSSGIYIYRLVSGEFTSSRRLLFLK